MPALVRLERWTDRESNAGTRLDFCKADQVLAAEDYREVSGREELDLSIDPGHLWMAGDAARGLPALAERQVVRTVFADDTYDEWRVWQVKRGRRKNGARKLSALCRSPKFDLGDELVAFPQASGDVFLHHELADITATDYLDVLDGLATWPGDFTVGTVEPTTRHTWVLEWESYLSALTEAATVTGAELQVMRDGTTGYLVDLLDEVRAGERTEIRYAANALESDVERDWSEAGTLVYPKGEGPQGSAPTIADMRWIMRRQAGEPTLTTLWRLFPWDGTDPSWLGLKPSNPALVCTEDDQYNGLYLGRLGGASIEIVDSAPANAGTAIDVTLASATAGGLWHILADSASNALLHVPVPSKIATHGRRAIVLERDDVPGVTNLVTLPFQGGKQGTHWLSIGSPTVTTVTLDASPEFVHFGSSSVRVQADAEQGFAKLASRVAGSNSFMVQRSPHLSFQVYGHLVAGSVRFEVRFEFWSPVSGGPGNVDNFVFPFGEDDAGNPIEARAVGTDAPFHLMIEPQTFNFEFAEGQVAQVGNMRNLSLQVIAREDGTEFYLDAWQVVNAPVIGEKIVAGASATRLWDAACRGIEGGIAEPSVRLRTAALDLDRLGVNPLDGASYTYGAVHPGVTARIVDTGIGLEEERRIKSVRRDLKREALTAIELMEAEDAT